jgi:hypothetical protein
MAVGGSCDCGRVRIGVPAAPEWIGRCNCSYCRKTGSLVAYYPDDGSVEVEGDRASYVRGDRMIAFRHCPECACFIHWESLGESYGRIGVNARLLDGYSERDGRSFIDRREVEVRYFDNADN